MADQYSPTVDRRTVLETTGASILGTALTAGTAAASEWRYEFVSDALDAGTHEAVVQGDWAYSANGISIATVDVSDPTTPVLGGTAAGHGSDNMDVKVDGDLAALANDGADPDEEEHDVNPGGVTFFDVSDPATPVELSFYEAASGIHNCFLDGDYAYLCVNDDFAYSRMVILDVSDPENPTTLEGEGDYTDGTDVPDEERGSGGAWMLRDAHRDMAEADINPIHDVYVQDDFAYMCFWDAGVVVADVSDKTDPTAVAHFGATDRAGEEPADNQELLERYLGNPGNAHYVQPTPDGAYTLVGDETFPGPFEDTVIPGDHGGIRIFDTSDLSRDSTPSNPQEEHVGFIESPDRPTDAIRTSHNFDVRKDKVFASFYQGGMRAYGIEDPTAPEELAAFAPLGTAYWTNVDLPVSGPRTYNLGSDIGKGLVICELVHETPGEQNWESDEDLGPRDMLEPTMQEPL